MTMKKTDLYKNLAKQIDRKQKAAATPQRFAAGATAAAGKREKTAGAAEKLVPLTCRLPAAMVARLRERALQTEGGMNAVLAQALGQWLAGEAAADPGNTP